LAPEAALRAWARPELTGNRPKGHETGWGVNIGSALKVFDRTSCALNSPFDPRPDGAMRMSGIRTGLNGSSWRQPDITRRGPLLGLTDRSNPQERVVSCPCSAEYPLNWIS
jgi:hypothetical protein